MIVLGIESSCDDTAIAIINDDKILAEKNSSQIDIHQAFGGVVPELAARNHVEIIDKLIISALAEANLKISQIELIAATGGPGLIGGVITSVMIAKGIALRNNIPLIFVNHLGLLFLKISFCLNIAVIYFSVLFNISFKFFPNKIFNLIWRKAIKRAFKCKIRNF